MREKRNEGSDFNLFTHGEWNTLRETGLNLRSSSDGVVSRREVGGDSSGTGPSLCTTDTVVIPTVKWPTPTSAVVAVCMYGCTWSRPIDYGLGCILRGREEDEVCETFTLWRTPHFLSELDERNLRVGIVEGVMNVVYNPDSTSTPTQCH